MEQYINKTTVLAQANIEITGCHIAAQQGILTEFGKGKLEGLEGIVDFINTLKVKEVDLEKEIAIVKEDYEQVDVAWNNDFDFIARHFFERGLLASNPITAEDRGMAEEIIINLKRVEHDYHIDLTKEMEWLRCKTQKGE